MDTIGHEVGMASFFFPLALTILKFESIFPIDQEQNKTAPIFSVITKWLVCNGHHCYISY